jgi:C-5 cytosine-specific DNA methylase
MIARPGGGAVTDPTFKDAIDEFESRLKIAADALDVAIDRAFPSGFFLFDGAEEDPDDDDVLHVAKRAGKRMVGGLYRRIRPGADGVKIQRAEIRFDDVAGCLRIPTGGSSRQTVVITEGASVRSRLLSPREAARLMGLDDSYKLPSNVNEALGLMGDGVVAPVVRHLAHHLLEPLLAAINTATVELKAAS